MRLPPCRLRARSTLLLLASLPFLLTAVFARPGRGHGHGRVLQGPGAGAPARFRELPVDPTTPLRRLADCSYDDGISSPRATFANASELPSPRELSNVLARQAESRPNEFGLNNMFWCWGQFIDHDMVLTPETHGDLAEPMPIRVTEGDSKFDELIDVMPFRRSEYMRGDRAEGEIRQQMNSISPLIDGSMVYGSTSSQARNLRADNGTSCFLEESDGGFLKKVAGSFVAGDIRAAEQPGLTALHTIFLREHNRIARRLIDTYDMTDNETIYETARLLVGAEIQQITLSEFLPKIMGHGRARRLRKRRRKGTVEPHVFNEFATACFRFGHTMVTETLNSADENYCDLPDKAIHLRRAFFDSNVLTDQGMDNVIRGLLIRTAENPDIELVDSLREFLFHGRDGSPAGLDLASLNIQRGRDHGLPNYCAMRQALGLSTKRMSYWKLTGKDADLTAKLALMYGPDPCEMDLWVASLVEAKPFGALIVGPTCRKVIERQFESSFRADEFFVDRMQWSEYGLESDPLVSDDLAMSAVTLAEVIQMNTAVGDLPRDIFLTKEPNEDCSP